MAFKYIAFAALLAYAHAGVVAPVAYAAAPVVAKAIAPAVVAKTVVAEEYDPHPQYNYGYDIHDGLTGDAKSQHEQRDGDVVQGSYSLIDADGFRRTVDYTADPIHGFNAVVRREPLGAPVVAKVAAAPVAYAAPAHYAAPVVAKTVAAAPVAYAAHHVAAPVAYAHAPVVAKTVAAPVAYAAPAHYAHPAHYAAPAHYAHAAHIAAPVAYSAYHH